MAKKQTTKTDEPAVQNSPGKPVLLPCRVLKNGMLYQKAHHGKGKTMSIPKPDAEELAAQGSVEIIPGLA